jgi:peroxiredoxin
MARVELDAEAPDFELEDPVAQNTVRLSDYRGQVNVLLVFNRGFI